MSDYSALIKIDVSDPSFARSLDLALKQIASTPEGRDLLQRAHDNWRKPIIITDYDEFFPNDLRAKTGASVRDPTLNIVQTDLLSMGLAVRDEGGVMPYSLQRVLLHELDHSANPEYKMEIVNAAWKSKTLSKLMSGIETHAMESTNAFMGKYFREPERDLNYENNPMLSEARDSILVHPEILTAPAAEISDTPETVTPVPPPVPTP